MHYSDLACEICSAPGRWIYYLWKNGTEFSHCNSDSLCTRDERVSSFQVLHGGPQLLDAFGDLICAPNNLLCKRQYTARACQTILTWTRTAIQALCHHRSYQGTWTVVFIHNGVPFLVQTIQNIIKIYTALFMYEVHNLCIQAAMRVYWSVVVKRNSTLLH